MRSIYTDMKTWVVDRTAAKTEAERDDLTPYMRQEKERYCEWLDEQKPDYLNEIERPGGEAA